METGGGDRGESTPLSAARAAAWARPTAQFRNIACVNHAPRVRQRLCSTFRLSLLALAFNILLLVVICVVSSQSEVMAWQE